MRSSECSCALQSVNQWKENDWFQLKGWIGTVDTIKTGNMDPIKGKTAALRAKIRARNENSVTKARQLIWNRLQVVWELLPLTPGTKVMMLYFWFLMEFLGYFSSHFSGQPSQTVLAFSSFLRHIWARQSQQLTKEDVNMVKNRKKKKQKWQQQDSTCLYGFLGIFFVPGESESSTLGHKINLTDD